MGAEVHVFRLGDVIGKTVVSVTTGGKLGTVSDALLQPGGEGVIGLVLGGGLLAKEHVLPLNDVQTFGADTVLARTDEHMMNAREWRQSEVSAVRSSTVRGRRVVTASGREIGHVSDFVVDETTGAFDALEIESRSLGGLRTSRRMISAASTPRVGPDAIVVEDNALEDPAEARPDRPQR